MANPQQVGKGWNIGGQQQEEEQVITRMSLIPRGEFLPPGKKHKVIASLALTLVLIGSFAAGWIMFVVAGVQ